MSRSDESSVEKMLERFEVQIKKHNETSFGYPCNMEYDYEELFKFFRYSLNNIGDPFVASTNLVNSRDFETSELKFFAEL